jgi:hypothetical protein
MNAELGGEPLASAASMLKCGLMLCVRRGNSARAARIEIQGDPQTTPYLVILGAHSPLSDTRAIGSAGENVGHELIDGDAY